MTLLHGAEIMSTLEERQAWDLYAAVPAGTATCTAEWADRMLAERRKRFGIAPPLLASDAKKSEPHIYTEAEIEAAAKGVFGVHYGGNATWDEIGNEARAHWKSVARAAMGVE